MFELLKRICSGLFPFVAYFLFIAAVGAIAPFLKSFAADKLNIPGLIKLSEHLWYAVVLPCGFAGVFLYGFHRGEQRGTGEGYSCGYSRGYSNALQDTEALAQPKSI
jgi:hypothetical protein